jgi:hypothetical protein
VAVWCGNKLREKSSSARYLTHALAARPFRSEGGDDLVSLERFDGLLSA